MPTPSTARMHDFEVVSNREIADGIFSLVISAPKLASALKPGQFVNIAVPGDASSLLRVPLSFYRADAEAGVYCEVSLERMMSCGFGACNTCNVETVDGMKGACMCGPVFDASKVVVF